MKKILENITTFDLLICTEVPLKAKFLNTTLFFISTLFIIIGFVLAFTKEIFLVTIFNDIIYKLLNEDQRITEIFTAFFGSFIFTWGMIILFLIVFVVMEFPKKSIHTIIFWGYTFWALFISFVFYRNGFRPMLFIMSIFYGIVFLVYLISLLIREKKEEKASSQE